MQLIWVMTPSPSPSLAVLLIITLPRDTQTSLLCECFQPLSNCPSEFSDCSHHIPPAASQRLRYLLSPTLY
ncbi:hypothetical protein BKA60DRAFT_572367 [Fusarium oxysporum]|nr:hypothetical protein BKA60DRAFT_572367 [Fusarium oxysporum]